MIHPAGPVDELVLACISCRRETSWYLFTYLRPALGVICVNDSSCRIYEGTLLGICIQQLRNKLVLIYDLF